MIFGLFVVAQLQVPCANPRVRQDFRAAQQSGKWVRLVKAFQQLKLNGRITAYAKLHSDLFSQIHNNLQFGMWHRAMLWELENEVQAIAGADVTLPYIDWGGEATTYNGQVDQSVAINPYFYGQQSGQCLIGQIWDSFNLSPIFNGGQCISRSLDTNTLVPGWADIDNLIINNNVYSGFSDAIQYGLHIDVHLRFGGHMGQTYSPVDPLFFAHHAFVDMTLGIWQFVHNNYNDMSNPAVSSQSFQINGNTYTHENLFRMTNNCVQYERYTNSITTKKLRKRYSGLVNTPTTIVGSSKVVVPNSPAPVAPPVVNTAISPAVPTSVGSSNAVAPNSPIPVAPLSPTIPNASTVNVAVATQTATAMTYTVPQTNVASANEIANYNMLINSHYENLSRALSSPAVCAKQITDFYPNSFIPVDSSPSIAALEALGVNVQKYNEMATIRNEQRKVLALNGNVKMMTVAQVLGTQNGNGFHEYSSIASSSYISFFVLTYLFQ